MDERLPAVMAEVRSLLDLPAGTELPPRALLEDTLTSGYAYALALEQKRLGIERSLRSVVRAGNRPDPDEVAALSGRLAEADQELAGVRGLLASLRAQALG